MIQSETPKNFKVIDKNIGYLMKTIPFAAKKAKSHYREAIKTAQEIGAKGFLGQSYLALVFLYNLKKRNDEARHYFLETISIFEDCEAYVFLEKAKKGLESLS